MNEERKENERPLLDHASDGIQELDNLLPRWWVWLFWICNVFAFLYMLYFHAFNFGDSQAAAYAKEAQAGERIKSAALSTFESNLSSLQPSEENADIERGRNIYTTYCAPCHRQ